MGEVLKLDQLQRKGRHIANRCLLCHENEESIDYILLHCVKTRVLWGTLFFPSLIWLRFSLLHSNKLWRNEGVLCREESEGAVGSCTFMPFLDSFGKQAIGFSLMMRSGPSKISKAIFCTFFDQRPNFRSKRVHTPPTHPLVGSIDWLGSS